MADPEETSMLSDIIKPDRMDPGKIRKKKLPSIQDIREKIEERKKAEERREIITSGGDDVKKVARREAEKILSEAQRKLKDAELDIVKRKQAVEQETRKSLEEVYSQKMETELKEIKVNLLQTLDTLGNFRKQAFEETRRDLVDLVFQVCRKIMKDHLKVSADYVADSLQEAFNKMAAGKVTEIVMHPGDVEMLARDKPGFLEKLQTNPSLALRKNPSLSRGACTVRGRQGETTTDPRQQLGVIEEELKRET